MTLYDHIGQLYVALDNERMKVASLEQDIETYKAQLMAKLTTEATNESKGEGTDPK